MSKKCFFWLLAAVSFAVLTMIPAGAQELPEPIGDEVWCARTQGFWKNHPEEWPVFEESGIGLSYFDSFSQADLIGELMQPVAKDVTLILIKQVIAAQLNVLKAPSLREYTVDGETVESLIQQANEALISGVFDWLQVEAIKDKLDTFNNSEACGASTPPGGDLPIPS